MSATAIAVPAAEPSYLTDGLTLRSWLLTTDHKADRAALSWHHHDLFLCRRHAAALIRLNLVVRRV